jgi:hypothetical protein
LSALGAKQKPHELFASLKAIEKDRQQREDRSPKGDAARLIQSGFLDKLIRDTGWNIKAD